ncbi:MAG: ROK family protein [Desulfarculus sp.]|nr:ROK family protein [Desulfarculus sp.]
MALDLGGTNVRLALVREGHLLHEARLATQAQDGPAALLGRLAAAVHEMAARARAEGSPPAGLGVASPGVIDRATGVVRVSPNLPGWRDVPLAAELSRATGLAVALENDANLYALGEYLYGAGQGGRDLACLTLGTGVGGGLILEGRLVTGALGSGGEIGHTLVEPGGRACGCGALGCLEAYASATGLVGMLAEALAQGRPSACQPDGDAESLARAARVGDALAGELFGRAGKALGRAIANLVAFTGLDLVVIGGGVAPAWPLMEQACRREMAARLRIVDPGAVGIVPAQRGDEAPLLGAAAFARQGLALD